MYPALQTTFTYDGIDYFEDALDCLGIITYNIT